MSDSSISSFTSTSQILDISSNIVLNSDILEAWKLQNLLFTSSMEELGLSANMDLSANANLDIISIDELLNSQSVILQKESDDTARLNTFFSPTMDSLRATLLAWASKGFPSLEKIGTLLLDPPDICSDGQTRSLPFYIEYVLQTTIASKLDGINAKTQGMTFTYSWVDKSITLHVSRT
jgi:hypothetical protein